MSTLTTVVRPALRVPGAGRTGWTRFALPGVLVLAAVLYGWGLSHGGDANEYYSAAVRSGATSWKAFFFGSLDSASYITVDKPPMALWVQEIFARLFGFGTWSLLLPSVLMGVAAVGVLYATVRRASGPVAGLIAALVMTLTPITVAIDHDNNPDTLLVLLLVLAAWACQRAVESGRLWWLVASAFLLGCGFNTKMLQAYLALPAFAVAYLFFARGGWPRRLWHLAVAGVVLAVSSFWWMVVVDLIPASRRPYIGGSTDNTVWNLVIGYNGLGRVLGGEGGPGGGRVPGGGDPGGGVLSGGVPGGGVPGGGGPSGSVLGGGVPAGGGPGGGGPGFAGASGWGRLFNDIVGGQISWLLPFAAITLVACLILLRRRPRTDPRRASVVLWGGWLVVHFTVFSLADGVMHPYYTTALAPAIAALTGTGTVLLIHAQRESRVWSGPLIGAVVGTGAWSFVLLRRTPNWHPWLPWTVAALTLVAAIALVARVARVAVCRDRHAGAADPPNEPGRSPKGAQSRPNGAQSPPKGAQSPPEEAASRPNGAEPRPKRTEEPRPEGAEAWPEGAEPRPEGAEPRPDAAESWPKGAESLLAEKDGGAPTAQAGALTAFTALVAAAVCLAGPAAYAASAATSGTNGTNPLAGPATGGLGMGGPGTPGGAPPANIRELIQQGRVPDGLPPIAPGGTTMPDGRTGTTGDQGGTAGRWGGGPEVRGPGGGGPGMNEANAQLITYLKNHRDGATWLVAVSSAQTAAPIILRTGLPVIAMGGFTGSDPAMTVPKLQAYVREGRLHYVLTGEGGPGGGGPGGGGTSSVTSWVTKNCSAVQPADYTSGSTSAQSTPALYRCG